MRKPGKGKPSESNTPKQARKGSEASVKPRLFPIAGIGASAGGLEAFKEVLHHLPEKTGMAFVLVQHLDPSHSSVLQELLSRITKIPVTEVTDGVVVEPEHVYVMPANTNMSIKGGVLRLAARALVHGLHMPINHFLSSLAEDRGDQAICVILSGTASDGTEGCKAIKAAGGITFAQEEESAKYTGMPHSAIAAGCVDFVMAPAAIAEELVRIGRHPYPAHRPARLDRPAEPSEETELDTLFSLVRDATGVDFAHYKQSTLQRRVKRRMVLHRLQGLKDYLQYIKSHPSELDDLYREILIHVTGFFRDPEAFQALRTIVLPNLFQDRKPEDSSIRIWVPGCSTGEESYSIAIIFLEYMWEQARKLTLPAANTKALQIFATDISDPALHRARAGVYTESTMAAVSPERRKRFFARADGGYQINKAVREMCIFARQNVLKDPPFSKLDLVSCRNLLIYLDPTLQKRAIPTFHYALKPGGYLMLGRSETLGAFMDYFTLVDRKHKIYQKKLKTASRLITYFSGTGYTPHKSEEGQHAKAVQEAPTIEKEVERVLVSRFVPASIVVNSDLEIVQFRGRTGAYLEPPAGQPTFSLSKMAREGLLVDLRAALNTARKENTSVRKQGVRIQSDGGTRDVDLDVIPVRGQTAQERFFIVVFQDAAGHDRTSNGGRRRQEAKPEPKSSGARQKDHAAQEVQHLREQLKTLIEDHETTLEQFKSANEEVLSANEELQSTNEELETAKEELQSSNEELTTLNEEVQNRNSELSLANNDLLNLLDNVNIPVVMVGNDLRIRHFTPAAQPLMNLLPADIGRRLGEIRPNVDIDNFEHIIREAMGGIRSQGREVRETLNGRWQLFRVRPYKTSANKIDGAVITFQDIDALKRNLEQTTNYANMLIENAREPTLVLDGSLRVLVANRAFYRVFRVGAQETEGRLVYELGNGQWNIPGLRQLLEDIIGSDGRIDDFEVRHDFPGIGPRTMRLNARRIELGEGRLLNLLSIEDATENTKHLEELQRQAALLELARDAVIVCDLERTIQFWNRGAEELYGWKKEEAIGRSLQELLHTEFPKPLEEIREDLVHTGYWEGELTHHRRDGRKRTVSSRWALQTEGAETPVMLEINSDITERKSSEDALRRVSGRLMRVQDDERRRIARELHDSTGQKLTAIKLALDMLQIKLDPKSKAYPSVAECMGWVEECMQEIRTVAQLLHPPLLDEAGLASAIRWLTQGFSSRAGIQVDLSLPQNLARMPREVELTLFRVVQEALNNIHRHADAKSAKIHLVQSPGMATLTISDDGKGIPADLFSSWAGARRPLGVGILGMNERLAQFGGRLEIHNGQKGAIVTAQVPTSQPEETGK